MKSDDLILVTDMQNIYRKGQKWACLDTEGTANRVLRIINAAECRKAHTSGENTSLSGRESRDDFPDTYQNTHAGPRISSIAAAPSVIFTEYLAAAHPHGAWKTYNEVYADIIDDPFLNDIVPELKEASRRYPLYAKSVYSSMKIPEVAAAARKAGRVVLTGVVSECCVLSTAFEAIDLGCKVVWLTDGVSGFDREKEKAAELMLTGLSPVHTALMTTAEYLAET